MSVVAWADGQLHAASRSYLARFDSEAVEVTPLFGRNASRTYPMRIAVKSVHRGNVEVWRASSATAPAPRLLEKSVSYDHSVGITERYDVLAAGLKQSVVFAERPVGSGDLIVRYAIETDLVCSASQHAGSLWFSADRFGGIEVGAVTGIDANGRRAAGHMTFDGEELQLVLPHEFVESAAYPLELDPLFGPQLNTGVSFDDHFPDTAYDEVSGVWCITFEFPASATSGATYIMRQDAATGAMLGGGLLANSGSRPQIASVRQSGRFLVVWEDNSSGVGNIRCRAVRASDGVLSNTVTVAGSAADERFPDVGGDAFVSQDLEALVVWEQVGAGILGVQVTVPVNAGDPVVLGAPVVIDPTPESTTPAISKSGGFDPANGGRYVVVWETAIGGSELIGYVGVDRDLNVLTPSSLSATGFAVNNPDVDGDGTEFLIVFESLESPAATASDIWCQSASFCLGGTSLCGAVAEALVDDAGDDEREPAVAFLGPNYVVAWADGNPGSTTDYQIGLSNVSRDSCTLCNQQVLTGNPAGFLSSFPALCSMRSNGIDSVEAFLTWEQRNNGSGNSLLRSHRYRPFTGGSVAPVAGVGGCGAGGTVGVQGAFSVGNPEFELTLRSADTLAPAAFLLFDTAMAAPTTCGSCTALTPQIVSPLFTVMNGEANVSLPIPCDAGLLGFAMDVQWAVVVPAAASPPCTLVPFVSLSDALRLVLGN